MIGAMHTEAPPFEIVPEMAPLEVWPDGSVHVAGTRITLEFLVSAHELGESPETFAADHDTVSVAQAYGALAWYFAHLEAAGPYIARQREITARLDAESRVRWPQEGLAARLLARMAERDAQVPG